MSGITQHFIQQALIEKLQGRVEALEMAVAELVKSAKPAPRERLTMDDVRTSIQEAIDRANKNKEEGNE